jgi:hypothetical protein
VIGEILTGFTEWEARGWVIFRVVSPRQSVDTVREWRIAYIDESRRRLYVCPDPRGLVSTPQWEGWDEPVAG